MPIHCKKIDDVTFKAAEAHQTGMLKNNIKLSVQETAAKAAAWTNYCSPRLWGVQSYHPLTPPRDVSSAVRRYQMLPVGISVVVRSAEHFSAVHIWYL
jgi:hypothetical protein